MSKVRVRIDEGWKAGRRPNTWYDFLSHILNCSTVEVYVFASTSNVISNNIDSPSDLGVIIISIFITPHTFTDDARSDQNDSYQLTTGLGGRWKGSLEIRKGPEQAHSGTVMLQRMFNSRWRWKGIMRHPSRRCESWVASECEEEKRMAYLLRDENILFAMCGRNPHVI